jgi:hypothetical protein
MAATDRLGNRVNCGLTEDEIRIVEDGTQR